VATSPDAATPSPTGPTVPSADVVGVVLCGGASRRMGRDKALIELDGHALAARVADALRSAGATRVLAIGGDAGALRELGLEPVPDRWPGGGPLGGLATALTEVARDAPAVPVASGSRRVLVAPCDLIAPDPATFRGLLAALDDGWVEADLVDGPGTPDATIATVDGRAQWVVGAWRATPALAEALADRYRAGDRRLATAGEVARWRPVAVPAVAVADADRPADLPPT